MKQTVTILGSTGSVGVNTLSVIRQFPDLFQVRGLAASSSFDALKKQAEEFRPGFVYLKDQALAGSLSKALAGGSRVFSSAQGLSAFSSHASSDILVVASSGTEALLSVIHALENGKKVALANKEILVIAGGLVMSALKKNPAASLIPVDSEHNAIFQCLQGHSREDVKKIILTGSGGPLREIDSKIFGGLSKEMVINHPKWKMGKKISVDSATLMNKGLEMIEASWLFDLPVERIEVLIHPQAVIHSMVEFKDGALLAQMGVTDMRLPIAHALGFPRRLPLGPDLKLDFSKVGNLTFSPPDKEKFPCLGIALSAARQAGSAPCVLSAADEVAVGAYLEDKIGFVEIPGIIESVLSKHRRVEDPDLNQIQSIHAWAVEETEKLCQAR